MRQSKTTSRNNTLNKTDSHQIELEYLQQKIFERYEPLIEVDTDQNQTLRRLLNNKNLDISYQILKFCIENGALIDQKSPAIIAEQRKFQSLKNFVEQIEEDEYVKQYNEIQKTLEQIHSLQSKYEKKIEKMDQPISPNSQILISRAIRKYEKVLN